MRRDITTNYKRATVAHTVGVWATFFSAFIPAKSQVPTASFDRNSVPKAHALGPWDRTRGGVNALGTQPPLGRGG